MAGDQPFFDCIVLHVYNAGCAVLNRSLRLLRIEFVVQFVVQFVLTIPAASLWESKKTVRQ